MAMPLVAPKNSKARNAEILNNVHYPFRVQIPTKCVVNSFEKRQKTKFDACQSTACQQMLIIQMSSFPPRSIRLHILVTAI